MSQGTADPGTPLVSIVTVVFNGAATLERTIRSVLAQDWPQVEYIIVDGGSTDGTVDIIRKHAHSLAHWVSEKDQGIYDAMNKGIALCKGEWVGLINADDAYALGAVRRAMEAVKDRPDINIVHGDIRMVFPDGSGKVKHARNSSFLLNYWEMVLNHPSFLVRRSFYRDHPFDPTFRVSGDHLWTLRAWRENRNQFLYLPAVQADFSVGGASMTSSMGRMLRESDRMCDALGFSKGEKWLARSVRIALYWPVMAKLRFNRSVAHLQSK